MDNGLLAGLAEGLKAGFQTYRDTSKDNEERRRKLEQEALEKKLKQFQVSQAGYQETPDGKFEMTDEAREEKRIKELNQEGDLLAKGLIAEKDASGKLIGYKRDPNFKKYQEKDPLAQALAFERLNEVRRKRDQDEYSRTSKGRLEGASGEVKAKVGALASALQSLTQYEGEFRSGKRRTRINSDTPIIGNFISDTSIDEMTRKLSDDIGRLRSGGAINVDEEKRFLKMLPRPGEEDIAAQKLINLRNELGTKLSAYGFKSEELPDALGMSGEDLGISGMYASMPNRGLLTKTNKLGKGGGLIAPPANASPGIPKSGDVVDGYRFKGGDPADQKNWEKK